MKHPPLKIFFCYAHEDRTLRQELDAHLDLLEREGLVTTWYDGRITPGMEWSAVIQENMRRADLVVCLISKAFLKSEYIAEIEMQLALELQEKGKARVIPLLLEPIRFVPEKLYDRWLKAQRVPLDLDAVDSIGITREESARSFERNIAPHVADIRVLVGRELTPSERLRYPCDGYDPHRNCLGHAG